VLPVLPSAVMIRRRSRMWWIVSLLVVIALACALTAFNFFYMPLDVAWFGLLRRLGN
jgi:uncharacterized membrane protein